MVEIVEVRDNEDENTDETNNPAPAPPPGKKYRKAKKELPSVSYLLAHGDPESVGKPKTWLDVLAFPIFLTGMFLISLQVLKHAPVDKNRKPKTLPRMQSHNKIQGHSMNQQLQQPQQHKQQVQQNIQDVKEATGGGVPENIDQMEELVEASMKGGEL